jgi:4-amino-4-deoxy-L-arabinose transferase-like glycosyltransferase
MLAVAAILLIATRAPHLAGPIDDPHSWRQCDTANYAWAFFHDGASLLRPAVCWMGGYRTLILEFPLPEYLMALAYRVFGYDFLWARLVTLFFFAGSALYLYLLIRELWNEALAATATLIYVTLPLALFYSRALHIDFTAIFFAHAMAYHLIAGDRRHAGPHLVAGAVAAGLAAVIKSPYALALGIPVAAYFVAGRDPRRMIRFAAVMILPVALGIAWQRHADAVNASAPDWSFIPGYFKFTGLSRWYFGSLALRFDPTAWRDLGVRLIVEVLTRSGAVLAAAGFALFIVRRKAHDPRAAAFLQGWIAAAAVHLALFFNLNLEHDYYQIPFLAPAALLMAIAILAVRHATRPGPAWVRGVIAALLVATVAIESIAYAERNDYRPDPIREGAGAIIASHTSEKSLVVVSEPATDCRDPRILFRARRDGWSIGAADLSAALVRALAARGATDLALVAPAGFANGPPPWLDPRRIEVFPIGDLGWQVMMVRLAPR